MLLFYTLYRMTQSSLMHIGSDSRASIPKKQRIIMLKKDLTYVFHHESWAHSLPYVAFTCQQVVTLFSNATRITDSLKKITRNLSTFAKPSNHIRMLMIGLHKLVPTRQLQFR